MGVNRNQSPGMAQSGGTNEGLTGNQGKNGKTAGNYSRNKQTSQQQLVQSRNAPPGSGNRGKNKNNAPESATEILENTGAVNRTTHSDQNFTSGVPSVLLAPGRHAAYSNSLVNGYHPVSVNSGLEISIQRSGGANGAQNCGQKQMENVVENAEQGSGVNQERSEQNEQIGKTVHPAVSDPNANSEQTASRTLGSTDTLSEDGMYEEEGVFGTKRQKWIPKQNHNLNGHTRKWEDHNTVIPKTDLENDDCKLEFVESDEDIFQLGLDEVLEEEKSYCLMGRFAGRFPGMRHVIQMVRSWKMECKAEYESNEHVRFRFKREEDRQTIFEGGPFHLFGKRLFLEKMKEDYVLGAKAFCCLPVWVRLPMLPMKCWNQKALSRIASKLGKPMFMDKFTYEQQKRNFARILVEMDCSTQPVETVSFKMPDGALWNQHIIFENLPPYCSRCGSEIHLTASCPLTKVENNLKERETEKEKNQNDSSEIKPGQNSNGESEAVEQSEEDEDNRAEDESESDGMSTEYEDMSEEAVLERLKILKGRNRTCKKPLSEGGGDDLLNEDRFGTKEIFQKPAGVAYESAVNHNGKTVRTLGDKEKLNEIVQALQVEKQCETSNPGERGDAKNKKKDVAMNSGKQNTAKMKKRGKDKGLYDADFFADLINSPEPTGEKLMAGGGGRRAPTLGDKC